MRSIRFAIAPAALLAAGVLFVPAAGVASASTPPPQSEPAPPSSAAATTPAPSVEPTPSTEPAPSSEAATSVAATTLAGTTTPPTTVPATPTESDHSQVIAQGVIDFPVGQFMWAPTEESVDGAGAQVDADGSQFFLAQTGTLVVTSGDGRGAVLYPGEAVFDPRSLPVSLRAAGSTPAGYWAILLTAGEFEAGAGVIEPGAGLRDVNLVRDVLAPGESLSVPSSFPELVVVTVGSVTVGGDVVEAGGSVNVAGGTSITNTGTAPATVVLTVIGDLLDAAAGSATTSNAG